VRFEDTFPAAPCFCLQGAASGVVLKIFGNIEEAKLTWKLL
jgi:hypothetical protein